MMTVVLLAALAAAPQAQEVKYGVGKWDPESGLGNHRVVVRVEALPPGKVGAQLTSGRPAVMTAEFSKAVAAVRVRIPWRRRDAAPDKKNVIVVDATTGAPITNVYPLAINREVGEIIFEPKTVPGDYYVYYMPYKSEGRKNYPNVKYDLPLSTADASWLSAIGLPPGKQASFKPDSWPRAKVIEIQAADEFSGFYPMEVTATPAETDALLKANPDSPYFLFPEDRRFSIRMTEDLPLRWIKIGPGKSFSGEASPGEYFTFQVGVWAARRPLKDVEVRFTDFKLSAPAAQLGPPSCPAVIPASAATCFNTGGSNWDGSPFKKNVSVESGKIQALWCGLRVPKNIPSGTYRGTVTVAPQGLPGTTVDVELRISGSALEDAGDDDPYRMTRLRWLDSRIAFDDDIVPPYTPLKADGMTVSCLGRSLTIGPDGLPASSRSSFAPEMTRFASRPVELVVSPFAFRIEDRDGKRILMAPGSAGPRFSKQTPGAVAWVSECHADALSMAVSGRMEFDGFVDYKIALTASRDLDLSDIRLEIPVAPDCARYMMGLGFKGGLRPDSFDWSWDRKKNQDSLWVGAVNAGLQVSLRAENYSRPLNTNFYLSKPLNMPSSWWNDGKGSVTVRTVQAPPNGSGRPGEPHVLIAARSGPRTMRAGETLHFDFTLLLTPFKLLDPGSQFSQRYFHAYKPLDEVAASGANIINVHHASEINPYINYPFLRPQQMKAYIDEAHRRGFKVKIYDTIRELSNRAPELFALRSLGHEVFSPGPGGGCSWLQEHVGADYIAAWFVPELKDAAIINSGMSRWHNYYLEGLDWLARNVGIDGLYLDDVAFDRTTMMRLRKILDRRRPGALIDLHSANQYNPRDGFASSANLYLEHFPFLNRLWFGEYFDYNGSRPDYWLVEMSGIPFGLMGEMLQDGGNPWRGMVFGMTSRLPWAGDPRPLWKAWDEFGITSSEMIGWWADSCPVKTENKDVLATVYVKKEKGAKTLALIALASWANDPVDIRLAIDWKTLGLDPKKAVLRAPAIDKFQPGTEFKPGDPLRIEPGKGWLLVLGE
jgi:hypothetical protein